METGGQCAMMDGPQWIQMWLADSQDSQALVGTFYVSVNLNNVIILHCSLADSTAYGNAFFGQGSDINIAMDDVGCTGSEASLFSCAHTTNHNCGHTEDAGVQCVTRECITFSHKYEVFFKYRTPVCITACSHGSIRLRGGSTSSNGRVEVCLNGDWGTVCHDRWSTVDSNVACRQLGFSNSGITFLCVVCDLQQDLYKPLYTINTSR